MATKSLSSQVAAQLRRAIKRGQYMPGDKLPTEPAMIKEFGVSRTVIRESIAELRADGLVRARHGIGVFVLDASQPADGLALLVRTSDKISDVIEELELRTAVEIEAAGLAAQRASPAQEAEIQSKLRAFAGCMRAGTATAQADFAFHMAIARATNNARFEEFLAHLGRRTIPRERLRGMAAAGNAPSYKDDQLHAEHRRVASAICARDVAGARDAMRLHLAGSLERYRAMSFDAE